MAGGRGAVPREPAERRRSARERCSRGSIALASGERRPASRQRPRPARGRARGARPAAVRRFGDGWLGGAQGRPAGRPRDRRRERRRARLERHARARRGGAHLDRRGGSRRRRLGRDPGGSGARRRPGARRPARRSRLRPAARRRFPRSATRCSPPARGSIRGGSRWPPAPAARRSQVSARPRVAIVASGDELAAAGAPRRAHGRSTIRPAPASPPGSRRGAAR